MVSACLKEVQLLLVQHSWVIAILHTRHTLAVNGATTDAGNAQSDYSCYLGNARHCCVIYAFCRET